MKGSARPGQRLLAVLLAAFVSVCGPAPQGDSPPQPPLVGPPSLIVRSSPGLERLAERLGRDPAAWRSLPGIADSLLEPHAVTVWFVADLAELDSLGLGTQEPWVAGVADPSRRLIGLKVDGPQRNVDRLLAVYRHEIAHVALDIATGGRAPTWLHEGYAQAASGTWDLREGWRLQFVLLRRGQAVLPDLDRNFRSRFEPQTAYILSYTVVDALRSLGGDAGLEALFAELRSGASLDASMRSVYGLTSEQFEARWRRRVLDRYGWLYLLSRTAFVWLSVTLLIVGVGVARVRRDRRRLREMKEREAWEEAMARPPIVTRYVENVDDPSNTA